MALSLDDAIVCFANLGGAERALISMRIFTSRAHVGAYVVEVCRIAGCGVDSDGALTETTDADLATYRARFLAACDAQGDGVIKRMDKASKGFLERAQRHEALVRAVYALGFELSDQGDLLG